MAKLYSHPDKLLEDHLFNVYRLGIEKFKMKTFKFDDLDQIKLITKIVLLTHDFGKANKFFQKKLELKMQNKDNKEAYLKLDNDARSNHSLLSALFTYYISNKLVDDELLSLLGMIVVYRHHSNLKDFSNMLNFSSKDWVLLEEQFNSIDLKKLQEILDLAKLEINITDFSFLELKNKWDNYKFRHKIRKLKKSMTEEKNYLITNLIYSLLISSDKAEAIFYNKGLSYNKLEKLVLSREMIPSDAVDDYKTLKGWDKPKNEMDKKRNQIYDEIMGSIDEFDLTKNRIFSINVPTGTGKTLASLSAGLKIRKKVGQNYRVIYTLPFTSIIDQNYKVFKDVFSEINLKTDSSVLIKHHYLTPKSYFKTDYEDEEYDVSKHLIESWNSEIIVTTFVQLLHSIFSNQNSSLIKFYNISNSIILLDEVQTIPHKYWKLIKIMLQEIANSLDCYFIFITATMPLIYNEYKKEINELVENKEDYFKFFDRIKLDLSNYRNEMTLENFKDFIKEELLDYQEKDFLIILNTIKSSIEIYDFIKKIATDKEVIYLSTNIIPKERRSRIKKIGNSNKSQIIVSTQMVEAGVDIDLDRVYRDFAPLDSINQSCGRCNRNFNSDKKGVVTLVKLVNQDHNNKAYASYIYGDILLRKTDKLLSKLPNIVKEKDFLKMNKKYFKEVDKAKSDDEAIKLLNNISKLEYEKAFWRDENDSIFQLIDQDFDTINLFIETSEKAKTIWNEYEKINKMKIEGIEDYNKRRAAFEAIKKDFLDYVITVSKNVVKDKLEDEELERTFNLIDSYQCETVYDFETGFKRGEDEQDYFF